MKGEVNLPHLKLLATTSVATSCLYHPALDASMWNLLENGGVLAGPGWPWRLLWHVCAWDPCWQLWLARVEGVWLPPAEGA